MRSTFLKAAALTLISSACQDWHAEERIPADSTSVAAARQDSINRSQPGYVVDSILPVDEELRRFRLAVGGTAATSFSHSSSSRDALVRAFVRALAESDAAAFRRMALTAREFSDLVYPESPFTRPPYRQAPGLVWRQIQNPGGSGLKRLTRRLAGAELRYVDHRCAPKPDVQGENRIWTMCTVRVVTMMGDSLSGRLFGSIIERHGQFKFVSYLNQF